MHGQSVLAARSALRMPAYEWTRSRPRMHMQVVVMWARPGKRGQVCECCCMLWHAGCRCQCFHSGRLPVHSQGRLAVSPQHVLVGRVQATRPGLCIVAAGIKERRQLKVQQGCGAVEVAMGPARVTPADACLVIHCQYPTGLVGCALCWTA